MPPLRVLLAALLAAMGPHLLRQPAWLLAVIGASVAWRYQVWSGRWFLPPWPVKPQANFLSAAV